MLKLDLGNGLEPVFVDENTPMLDLLQYEGMLKTTLEHISIQLNDYNEAKAQGDELPNRDNHWRRNANLAAMYKRKTLRELQLLIRSINLTTHGGTRTGLLGASRGRARKTMAYVLLDRLHSAITAVNDNDASQSAWEALDKAYNQLELFMAGKTDQLEDLAQAGMPDWCENFASEQQEAS